MELSIRNVRFPTRLGLVGGRVHRGARERCWTLGFSLGKLRSSLEASEVESSVLWP